ncbi:MAG: NAD(+)/NADH kinase [Dehalococcoidia bacterium]|nr:NAD(+)/NADH kinase [Dehalococcoidia bacterium]MDD5493927.1 NAD(+)/NADH kinase [Dehalococcoidia bacterium]
MKRIGILFHPKVQTSENFACQIEDYFKKKGVQCWLHSSWDESGAQKQLDKTDLMISVGGDGTILRVARIVYPRELPIVGVNFGKLGFMAELEAGDALEKLSVIIDGGGWMDERSMLQAQLDSSKRIYHALNDVVVGRGQRMRLINVDVSIDGEMFTTYRADAVIVATPTGSTGYSLAANGPIIHPESKDIILKAVCPHLNMDKALVLAAGAKIKLKVRAIHDAIISMDGQVEEELKSGDEVNVSISPHVTRFVRLRPRSMFYTTLVEKLKGKSL